MPEFNRITRDPKVMQGKACIRGTRVTVSMLLGQLSGGATIEELLAEFPYISRDDILEALRYGAYLAQDLEVALPRAS